MLKTTLLFGLAHSNRVLVARFGDVKQHNPVQSKKALAHIIIAQSQRRQSKMRIKSEKEKVRIKDQCAKGGRERVSRILRVRRRK